MERGNRKEIGNILKRGSGVVGRDRKAMTSSEVVGSRKSSEHKGRTFEFNYTIVKRELICVNEEVKSDMWERKKGPLRRAQSTKHAQSQNRKRM